MNVLLAGFNVDADIIKALKEKAEWDMDNVTPETLSASYARISRDPRDISVLRQEACAEVDSARKSNEKIIFGFGHHSVAEHAVFNLDIIGISRLAVEEVQRFRLASYTEKSQRYITLEGDYHVPDEIKKSGLEKGFHDTIAHQNQSYKILYERLKEHLFRKHSEMITSKIGERTVDGWAKEDARYVVSLATLSQFGMTVNARKLEHMLRRFRSSNLSEIRTLADRIYSIVGNFSPSIMQFTEATPYDTERPELIHEIALSMNERLIAAAGSEPEEVKLISHTAGADDLVCAAVLFHDSSFSFEQCLGSVKSMTFNEKEDILRAVLSYREFYDSVDRVFEMIDFVFELTVSASNYAQMKRHRMSTQIVKDYNIEEGFTIPRNIIEIEMTEIFKETMERTGSFYRSLSREFPEQKDYILTNAHRRKVLLKMNARELYHFVSLRDDEHAQWDIRDTAALIREKAVKAAPLTTMMLCGKSDFEACSKKVFG